MAIDIIYIAGSGRSGTTLYDRILGTVEGAVSINENYHLWQEGVADNSYCACGALFNECDFWQKVMAGLVEEAGGIDEILHLHHAIDHSRHFLNVYTGLLSGQKSEALERYVDILRKLYLSIAETSGASIIVDSSKVPTRALLLDKVPEFNVHVVHAVRDVRALIYAWKKKKFNPAKSANLSQYSLGRTVSFWLVRNVLCELLSRRVPYQRLRYEDFVKNPQSVIENVVQNIEPLRGKYVPFKDERSIELGGLHTIGGNPHRFKTGLTKIEADDEWHSALGKGSSNVAGALAAPLLLRYGYSVAS